MFTRMDGNYELRAELRAYLPEDVIFHQSYPASFLDNTTFNLRLRLIVRMFCDS
jgi:hypothetical protein